MTACTPVTACRSCGGPFGPTLCDLGLHPLSNAYLPPGADPAQEQRFPLRAVVCSTCRMVQLDHVVEASAIFHADYAYFSSMSASWLDHAARFAAEMIARLSLTPASRVIEVASNDGYLLRNFVAAGIPCLGVEPSDGVARAARAAGVPTLTAFLTETTGREIATDGPADLVVANNVLAHVPDVNDFTAGLAALLSPEALLAMAPDEILILPWNIRAEVVRHWRGAGFTRGLWTAVPRMERH